jgi:hypothetical protein
MVKDDAGILEALATIWLRGTAVTASGSEIEIVYLWRLNGGIP